MERANSPGLPFHADPLTKASLMDFRMEDKEVESWGPHQGYTVKCQTGTC